MTIWYIVTLLIDNLPPYQPRNQDEFRLLSRLSDGGKSRAGARQHSVSVLLIACLKYARSSHEPPAAD